MTTKKTPGKDLGGAFVQTLGFPDSPDEPAIPSRRDQKLQMYFDDELDRSEADEFKRELDRDPEMRRHLEDLGTIRGLVSHSLELRASEVPRARFEQIWDEIDRSIDAEARSARVAPPESIWSRLLAAFRPYRMPVLAAAGAALVAVAVIQFTGTEPVNEAPIVASEEPPAKTIQSPSAPEPGTDHAIERSPEPTPAPEVFPAPKVGEAEIHGIEFGGKTGRISQNGTVTVLYVEEDATPAKSERSL